MLTSYFKVFILAILGQVALSAPPSHTLYSNGFTYFISAVNDRQTWSQARQTCLNKGMGLLEIRNYEEQQNYMTQVEPLGNVGWRWAGATDESVENEWRWISDNSVTSFTNWQRNNRGHFRNRNCLQVQGKLYNYRWHDANCNLREKYVCYTRPAPVTTTTTTSTTTTTTPRTTTLPTTTTTLPTTQSAPIIENAPSKNHVAEVAGSEYFISAGLMNFYEAQILCAGRGMQLLELRTAERVQEMKTLFSQTEPTQTWVGLTDVGRKGRYYWVSDKAAMSFDDFQPNTIPSLDCVVTGPRRENYAWLDISCLQELPVICTKPVVIAEESPTKNYNKIIDGVEYFISMDRVNFYEAQISCADRGMQLIELQTAEKVQAMKTLLAQTEATQTWIGLTDVGRKGRYYWLSDKSSLLYSDFQPNTVPTKDCVATGPSRLNYAWRDVTCMTELPIICSKTALVTTTAQPTTPVTSPPSTVENSPTRNFQKTIGGTEYFISADMMNFNEAKNLCDDRGMQILELRTVAAVQAMNTLLGQTQATQAWIGLTDIEQKGRYYWISDKSAMNYQDFSPNTGRSEDCVVTGPQRLNYSWNDISCMQEYPVICTKVALNRPVGRSNK